MTASTAIDRLRSALDDLARALSSGDADLVLLAEPPLAEALSTMALVDVTGLDAARRVEVRDRLDEALHALARCEALGDVVREYSTAVWQSDKQYGRGGRAASSRGLTTNFQSEL